MKTELKHLAPYLPYGLKSYVEYDGHKLIKDINVNNVMCIVDGEVLSKPILRPLSDLTKEIEVNMEKFYPYEKLHLCYSDVTNFLNDDLWIGQWWDYEKVTKLFEWHFDVFGLIEKGLAIDINTL